MTLCGPHTLDSFPIKINWKVVRGDTATLRVDFLENDELTFVDISDWEFAASAYDSSTQIVDDLEVVVNTGYVEIIAEPFITENWGISKNPNSLVAKLSFDLQVITSDDITWTPIIGDINVIGDITGSSL